MRPSLHVWIAFFALSKAFPYLYSFNNVTNPLAKTILLTNDDGWASTNIRATYRALKTAGHNVVMVAPAIQRSGMGGTFELPQKSYLEDGGEFNYPPPGLPAWGHESNDLNMWYFDGTPASCVAFALNHVMPQLFPNKRKVDLVVAGPNEGHNLGPGFFEISGTLGAASAAALRGIPSIAFSGSNENNSFYQDDWKRQNDTLFGPNILAKKVVQLVEALFIDANKKAHILPVTTGFNVNFPPVGKHIGCIDPEFVHTRISGPESEVPDLVVNHVANMPERRYTKLAAPTKCIFGDCQLPSEAQVLKGNLCQSSVSLFSIDYDAHYKQALAAKTLVDDANWRGRIEDRRVSR